jgi:hypothetical protein
VASKAEQSSNYWQPGIFDLSEFFLELGGIALAVPPREAPAGQGGAPAWGRTGLLILPSPSVSVGGHQVQVLPSDGHEVDVAVITESSRFPSVAAPQSAPIADSARVTFLPSG